MATDTRVDELERMLESDPELRRRYEDDPVATLEQHGLDELASELEREAAKVRRLVERLESDEAFRAGVRADPRPVLEQAGLDPQTVEPFLRALDAPAELVERASADVDGYVARPPVLPWPWRRPDKRRPSWFPSGRADVFET